MTNAYRTWGFFWSLISDVIAKWTMKYFSMKHFFSITNHISTSSFANIFSLHAIKRHRALAKWSFSRPFRFRSQKGSETSSVWHYITFIVLHRLVTFGLFRSKAFSTYMWCQRFSPKALIDNRCNFNTTPRHKKDHQAIFVDGTSK